MLILFGELKLEPPKYYLVGGKETKGWWIFKREVEVWYLHSDQGMSLGPYYNIQDAQWALSSMRNA
jgi:hypothetical protein